MHNIDEQIADIESQIAVKNTAIARMEEALEAHGDEQNEWFRACSFNLNKADLERESLQRKLDKLLSNQRHLAQQEASAKFKEKRRQEIQASELNRIMLAGIAKKKDANSRQIKAIDMHNRKCVEFRRLIVPFVGEEQSYAISEQAEKLAQEWMDKREQAGIAAST